MFKFILLTFISYLSIDLAVYSITKKLNVEFMDILLHHLKMLPIYLVANILISYGFMSGADSNIKPLLLFNISICIWAVSLVLTAAILYKTYPNALTVLGGVVILLGVMVVNYSIKS